MGSGPGSDSAPLLRIRVYSGLFWEAKPSFTRCLLQTTEGQEDHIRTLLPAAWISATSVLKLDNDQG